MCYKKNERTEFIDYDNRIDDKIKMLNVIKTLKENNEEGVVLTCWYQTGSLAIHSASLLRFHRRTLQTRDIKT